MNVTGHCYCGALKYAAEGDPVFKGQCHCRECQYVSGGMPVIVMAMPEGGFRWTQGEPRKFSRSDLAQPVTREFCGNCGTQVTTRAPGMPGTVMIKVGTMDDPSQFGGPQMVIYTCDKQPYHQIPAGIPAFERLPGG